MADQFGGYGYNQQMYQDPNYMGDDFYSEDPGAWDAMSDGATEMSGNTMYSQDCSEPCPPPPDFECPTECCPLDCGPEGTIVGDLNFDVPVSKEQPREKRTCGENLHKINMVIDSITPATVLDEFMMSVAEFTTDRGEAMYDTMSNEVQNFKELIKEIYNNRNDNVSDLIRAQQRQQKNKYDKWTKDLNNRADLAMEKLKRLMPNFNMAAYTEDPDGYIYNAVMELSKQDEKQRMDSGGGNNLYGQCGALAMTDRGYRVGLHKKTWLNREAEKIECENEERMAKLNDMMGQLACLSEGLATSNKKLAAYNRQLEGQATCLRNKLAANERVINCLMDDKSHGPEIEVGLECDIIQPDDVLTVYPRGYGYC